MHSSRNAKRGEFPDCREDASAAPIKSAGVIGAGTMGGGIAICFANAGIPVTLLDANAAGLCSAAWRMSTRPISRWSIAGA